MLALIMLAAAGKAAAEGVPDEVEQQPFGVVQWLNRSVNRYLAPSREKCPLKQRL